METHGRSGGTPESESCQSRAGCGNPSFIQYLLGGTPIRHMNFNWQPEIKLLGSNWLPEMLPLLLWPKKLLLGIGIGVGYKLSHNGGGKNEFKDLIWSSSIQYRE
jgi:hypothetical protein